MSKGIDRFMVQPETKVSLSDWPTDDTRGVGKKEGCAMLAEGQARLNELQELLRASDQRALLIVLQGMDTAGKDGVIKHVVGAFNPQGCQVTSFKVPTEQELAHDFLWRVHKATPERGMVGIFNRSHYEDVLVVRVEELVPKDVWSKRYAVINDFERQLTDSGIRIVKLFLHVSPEKQKERLEDRLVNPRDHWKFRLSDLAARTKWDQYMAAYEAMLNKTSTDYAPWYVIPADRKWYRNLVASEIVAHVLTSLDLKWPPLEEGAEDITIE
jgi:PPK2 family polyphosphate:nucleotide phosphotransferase